MNSRPQRTVAHRDFYRRLDMVLRQIDKEQGLESLITHIITSVIDVFEDVGISSGRLYRGDGDHFVVVRSFGARGKAILGEKVPAGYPVLQGLERDAVTYFAPDHADVDVAIEERLGVGHFASFYVDQARQYVVAFGYEPEADLQEVKLTLNTLRYAIAHRLTEMSFFDQLEEARHIQMSLLPVDPPRYEGYDLAGKSIPAEQVGGDIFDFIPVDDHLLGIAIADASGHGLPAALQARDVVIGLRMAVERDLKITAVTRKLNRVIHHSGLTSRFVSLVYGELETNGNFVYVNAGHDPPMLLKANGTRQDMRATGIVMGPLRDATFRRDLVVIEPGDALLLYTDGVVERLGPEGEYGRERLESHLRELVRQGKTALEVCEALLGKAYEFGQSEPWNDDATIVVMLRQRG